MKEQQPLRPGHIRLRLHGVSSIESASLPVDAGVFARKLGTLLRGLSAADKAANQGKATHHYTIADLKMGSAVVEIAEHTKPKFSYLRAESSIGSFEACVAAIRRGAISAARSYGGTATEIARLAAGSGDKYGYGELWTSDEPLRLDGLLKEQADAAAQPALDVPKTTDRTWFKGIVDGSFDGEIKVVDLRGALPAGKLILSAGGKEIDCVFISIDFEDIRASLRRRSRITGQAVYDGKSGLPRRIEIRNVTPVRGNVDFSKWGGAFEPFRVGEWDVDA